MGGPGFMRTRICTTGPNLESGPHRVSANRPVRLPSVHSSVRPSVRSSVRPAPVTREPTPRRAGTGGLGDRKELCIKMLYVRDRLCQQPLSCVRNASRRARCWLLLTLVATCRALRQLDREGAVGSYSRIAPLAATARLPRS